MKILVRFVQKVHWFNPVIFFFSRKFCEECEYTCDMEVVRNYNREKRIQYGDCLLYTSHISTPEIYLAPGGVYARISNDYIKNNSSSATAVAVLYP